MKAPHKQIQLIPRGDAAPYCTAGDYERLVPPQGRYAPCTEPATFATIHLDGSRSLVWCARHDCHVKE